MSTYESTSSRAEKSPKDTFDELRDMVTGYAKQETVDPLKHLGRWLAFGVSGALSMALGLVLLGLGGLRALQTTTGWSDGNLSWLPYVIMFAVLAIAIAITVQAMLKRPEFGEKS